MKFRLEFDMDNEAFNPEDGSVEYGEVRRILEKAAIEVENMDSCNISDINGNTVGNWEIVQ